MDRALDPHRKQSLRAHDWVYLPPTRRGTVIRVWLPKTGEEVPFPTSPSLWDTFFSKAPPAQRLLLLNAIARDLARTLEKFPVDFLHAARWSPQSKGGRELISAFHLFAALGSLIRKSGYPSDSPEVRAVLEPLLEELRNRGTRMRMTELLRGADAQMQKWVGYLNHLNLSSTSAAVWESVSDWFQSGDYRRAEKESRDAIEKAYAPLYLMADKHIARRYEAREIDFIVDYSDMIGGIWELGFTLDRARERQNHYQTLSRDQIWAAEAILLTAPMPLVPGALTAAAATGGVAMVNGEPPTEAVGKGLGAAVGRALLFTGHPVVTTTWRGWIGVQVGLPALGFSVVDLFHQFAQLSIDGGIKSEEGQIRRSLDGGRLMEAGITGALISPLLARFRWLAPPTFALFGYSAVRQATKAIHERNYGDALGHGAALILIPLLKPLLKSARATSPTYTSQRENALKTLGLDPKSYDGLTLKQQREQVRSARREKAKKGRQTNGNVPDSFKDENNAMDFLLKEVDARLSALEPEPAVIKTVTEIYGTPESQSQVAELLGGTFDKLGITYKYRGGGVFEISPQQTAKNPLASAARSLARQNAATLKIHSSQLPGGDRALFDGESLHLGARDAISLTMPGSLAVSTFGHEMRHAINASAEALGKRSLAGFGVYSQLKPGDPGNPMTPEYADFQSADETPAYARSLFHVADNLIRAMEDTRVRARLEQTLGGKWETSLKKELAHQLRMLSSLARTAAESAARARDTLAHPSLTWNSVTLFHKPVPGPGNIRVPTLRIPFGPNGHSAFGELELDLTIPSDPMIFEKAKHGDRVAWEAIRKDAISLLTEMEKAHRDSLLRVLPLALSAGEPGTDPGALAVPARRTAIEILKTFSLR